jgi:ABC-type multidrug transport system fused ATPase/permease subunit
LKGSIADGAAGARVRFAVASPGPQRRRLTLGLLCTFGAGLATLLLPTFAGRLVEAFPTPGTALIGALALALAARSVLGFAGTTALGHVAARAVTDLRWQLFGRLLHAPLSFHHSRWSSELVSTLGTDTSLVEQLLQALLPSLAQFVPLALAALALAWLNPPLSAGLAVAALPLLLLLYLAGRALRRIGHAGQARLGELSVLAQESLRAAWLVKSLTREALFVARVAAAAETLYSLKARRVRWQAIPLRFTGANGASTTNRWIRSFRRH